MRSSRIVRFNWPFYVLALVVMAAAPAMISGLPVAPWLRAILYAGPAMVAFWLAASLAASWIVYDGSRLMEWDWVLQALGFHPASWINIHAGHDDSTLALRHVFNGAPGRVFDIFDPVEMTEPSIAKARRLAGRARQHGVPDAVAAAPEHADYRHLPVATGTIDAAMLLLSAHELRSESARAALFTELRRVLGPGGRVVVAEHLRDWVNFVAFGPGFLHFHSRRTWTRCFSRHRFDIHREFSITPFVRIFVLRRLT
jgi:SAM-dependent methyltransferase